MINIEVLYQTVRTLLRKDHAGWISSDEFNQVVALAQEAMFGFYLDSENERDANDALNPFEKTAPLTKIAPGQFSMPTDYKARIEAVTNSTASDCSTEVNYTPVRFITRQSEYLTLSSPIRGPKIDSPKCVIRGDVLTVYPGKVPNVTLRYYRQPIEAIRAYTLNTISQEEEYDEANSVNLEWSAGRLDNFVDYLLYYKGLSLRETELIQWVQAKQVTTVNND
jgi:hypothetical protein